MYAQLDVDVSVSPSSMVKDQLLGESIMAMNVKYIGHLQSRGSFNNSGNIIPFKHGVVLSSGYVTAIPGRNKSSSFSGVMGEFGDLDLSQIAAGESNDAAVLEFDFVATDEMVSFRYIFASEEYPEYVNSDFNDVFAFYLTDKLTKETWNLATIPTTNIPITINSINDKWNFKYYVNNLPENFNTTGFEPESIEMDGFTKPLVAYHSVVKGRPYHIKIAICDVGDANLDSSVFLEGGSFSSQSEKKFYEENSYFINSFEESNTTPVAELQRQEKINAKNENRNKVEDTTLVKVDEAVNSSNKPKEFVLYFATDAYKLSDQEFKKLNDFIQNNQNSKLNLLVVGHTDNVGATNYNMQLSKKRAQLVAQIIQVNTEFLCTTVWKGEENPLNTNSSEKERGLNRRVVIQFK